MLTKGIREIISEFFHGTQPVPLLIYDRYDFYFSFQDKMFIYRGEELETLAAFTTRIRHDFPNAEVRNNNNNEVLVDQDQYFKAALL